MSKLIRVNINLDNSHSLTDFPVDIYSGTTTGNTTNLVYMGVTTSPVTFTVDDSIMEFGLKLVSTGCLDQVLLIESPSVDCEICADFVEFFDPAQPTPTPSTTPIVVSDTDVFLNDSGSPTSIYSYNPNTTVLTYLYDSTNGSSDIANTSNKLWVYNGGGGSLLEYDITLSPFSQTYNRTITSVYHNAGLCAIDDTTLININGSNVYEIDITTNVASSTLKWSTISGRSVAGDYMYTTTNKLIITNNSSSGAHITQYDYTTGTVEVDLDITATIPFPYGVFEYGSEIYIVNSNGKVYQIMGSSPYTLTLVDDMPITVFGASQIPSKITEDFTPVTESTPTPSPTPSSSPTPTPTPSSTSTPTPTPSPSPSASPTPTPSTTSNCDNYSLVPDMGETTASYRWKECGSNEFSNWTGVSGDQLDVCAESGTVSKVSGNGSIFIGNECYPDPLSYNMSNSTNSNGNACEQINTYPIQVFSEGNGFQLNSIVHQTVQLNNPFVGDNTYYKLNKNGGIILQISGSGEITGRVNCVLD